MQTLSFVILDDLRPGPEYGYGPIHIPIENIKTKTLESAVNEIAKPFLKYIARRYHLELAEKYSLKDELDEKLDPTGYFFETDFDIEEIVNSLIEKEYYCLNRYCKYYVVAFALNYARFEVFSKDCDKELIKWNEGEMMQGPIVNRIQSENYNENPVVSLLKKLFFSSDNKFVSEEEYWNQYDSLDSDKEEFMGYEARDSMLQGRCE